MSGVYDTPDFGLFVTVGTSQDFPAERQWYQRLATRLGRPEEMTVVYHATMILAKNQGCQRGGLQDFFPDESPENRGLLAAIMERVIEGEYLPAF